jgi:hypothetical protein
VSVLVTSGEGALALYRANTRDVGLFITDRGWAVTVPMHQMPDGALQSQGLPLDVLARQPEGHRLVAALSASPGGEGFLCLGTRQGRVKRVALAEVAAISREGATTMGVGEDDAVAGAVMSRGNDEIVLVSAEGKVIRFPEGEVRAQGLSATGMKGFSLKAGDAVVSLALARPDGELVLLTARGFAKRTPIAAYPAQGRGGQGSSGLDVTKAALAGPVVAAMVAPSGGRLLISTSAGRVQPVALADVPALDRTTWGRVVTRTRSGAVVSLQGEETATGIALSLADGGSGPAAPASPVGHGKGPVPGEPSKGREPDGESTPRAKGPTDVSAPAPPKSRARRASGPAQPSSDTSHADAAGPGRRGKQTAPKTAPGPASPPASEARTSPARRRGKAASAVVEPQPQVAPVPADALRRRRGQRGDVAPESPPSIPPPAAAATAVLPTPPGARAPAAPEGGGAAKVTQDTLAWAPDGAFSRGPAADAEASPDKPQPRRPTVRKPPQRARKDEVHE